MKSILAEIKNILKNKPRVIFVSVRDNPKLNTNEDVIELKSVIGTFDSKGGKTHKIKLKEYDDIWIWELDVNDRVVINGKCYIQKANVDL